MVYDGKPYFLMDDLGGKPTIFGNTHMAGLSRPLAGATEDYEHDLSIGSPYLWEYLSEGGAGRNLVSERCVRLKPPWRWNGWKNEKQQN